MTPKCPVSQLPCGIWERIAFYVVASEGTFLGPPTPISTLSLLSRDIYNQLSFKNNTHLYARIFCFKFDTLAPCRRLSSRWRTTKSLTAELIKRFQALQRIKLMEAEVDDIWTAYLMCLENDGRNEAQLVEYAKLKQYLKALFIQQGTAQDLSWFKNPVLDSLAVWLLWETTDRESIRLEGLDSAFRNYLVGLLHSFIIAGYKFPSTYGPDFYFSLPLCPQVTQEDLDGCWQRPPKSEVLHYSHKLRLAAPVIAPAAILALVVQADAFQDSSNLPNVVSILPRNRADAIAQGRRGPTVADIFDYHLNTRPPTSTRPQPTVDFTYVEDLEDVLQPRALTGGSMQHDEDWYRLVSCHDPWAGDSPLRGPVYQPGILSGKWAGRLLVPDFVLYSSLLQGRSGPSTVSIRHNPLYWELEEHHCLSSNEFLPPGGDEQWGDDVLNAWLPRELIFTHLEGALEVYDPNTKHSARYETVVPGKADLYSSNEKGSKLWISGQEISDGHAAVSIPTSGLELEGASIDDDDEYSDTVSHLSSGVSDILITGKTGESAGEAWGNFTIHGRVRPWDGLIALLRVPSDPSQTDLGRWIFKGYLHGQNLVGRWRETSTPLEYVGYEGGFVVYRTDSLG